VGVRLVEIGLWLIDGVGGCGGVGLGRKGGGGCGDRGRVLAWILGRR
jgi:hypothetical protein